MLFSKCVKLKKIIAMLVICAVVILSLGDSFGAVVSAATTVADELLTSVNQDTSAANTTPDDNIVLSGVCGDNAVWTHYSDGTLVIDGIGATDNFNLPTKAPWYTYAEQITRLEIAKSITMVGNNNFSCLTNLTYVVINNPDMCFGLYAFSDDINPTVECTVGSVVEAYSLERGYKVSPLNPMTPLNPVLEQRSANSITLEAVEGYEYGLAKTTISSNFGSADVSDIIPESITNSLVCKETYNVNITRDATFISNANAIEPTIGNKVYMVYTVDSVEEMPIQQGVAGCADSYQQSPYFDGGLLYYGDAGSLLKVGYTYFIEFVITENGFEYTIARAMGDDSEYVTVSTVIGDGTADMKHFGLWLDGGGKATLKNVRIYDANYRNLGLQSNTNSEIVCTAKPNDGIAWQSSNVFEYLTPGVNYTFYQRVIEDGYHLPVISDKLEVTTLSAPVCPDVESVNGSTVTLKRRYGYEYSLNGTDWQQDAVFKNLSFDEELNIYQRKMAVGLDTVTPASEPLRLIINSAPRVFVGKTVISVVPSDNFEYCLDDMIWQDSNVFDKYIVPNESYVVYRRQKTADSNLKIFCDTNGTKIVVNGKNKITEPSVNDLVWIKKRLLLGDGTNNLAADFNEDFEVDILDFIKLAKTLPNPESPSDPEPPHNDDNYDITIETTPPGASGGDSADILGFTKVSFENVGIDEGKYDYNSGSYAVEKTFNEGFDKKYFSGKLKFEGNNGAILYIAGTQKGKGLNITTNNTSLIVKYDTTSLKTISASSVGLGDTFKDKEFTFGVSFELSGNALKIGIYINGVLNGDIITKNNYKSKFGKVVSIKCNSGTYITVANDAGAKVRPDDYIDWITTSDFYVADGTYGYNNGEVAVKGSRIIGLADTYFAANVKFSALAGATIRYGGKESDGGLTGLIFGLSGDKLTLRDGWAGSTTPVEFIAADAGLTAFADTQFKLGISLKIKDTDTDGEKDDIELGVWFNDTLYNNNYIMFANYASFLNVDKHGNFANTLAVSSNVEGSTVAIGGITELVHTVPDNALKRITFEHFGIESKKYDSASPAFSTTGAYTDGLDGTYFSGYVTYKGTAQLIYGMSGSGLVFTIRNGKFRLEHNALLITPTDFDIAKTGLKNLTDSFRLGISTQFIDNDGDGEKDDLKLGVFFNEKLYDDQHFYYNDYLPNIGTAMAIYGMSGDALTAENILEFKDPIKSRPLDESFKKFTFDALSIADGTYTAQSRLIGGEYTESLDGAVFGGKITFSDEVGGQIFYAARPNCAGMSITIESDGRLKLGHNAIAFPTQFFLPSKAGLESFTGTPFDLWISTRYVDSDTDGQKDDVELGMWFNGILYADKFITIPDYVQHMSSKVFIYCPPATPDTTITVESIAEFKEKLESRPLDETLKKFTFETVSINDGQYGVRMVPDGNGGNTVQMTMINGAYSGSFDGAVFGGKVTFSKATGAQMLYAAAQNYVGISINITDDGRLVLSQNAGAFETKYFLASKVGLETFADTPFDLWISTKYVDSDSDGEKDDVELGMWFNGMLYSNKFIYLTDYVSYMDKNVFIYCPAASPESTITVASLNSFIPVVIPEELDPSFKLITLNNFSIPNKAYQDTNGADPNGLCANGNYLKTLNNTYFAFNANFTIDDPDTPISFQYAGAGDGWAGFCFEIYPDKITAGSNGGHSEKYTFTAKRAKVSSFVGQDIKMGISTQYLDLDGDGAEDDVRFGLWINDYLANNEYMNVIDYRQYIGNDKQGIGGGLGIYIKDSLINKPSIANLWSVHIPVDFGQFGFTDDWIREI